jgi:hypothetical protein
VNGQQAAVARAAAEDDGGRGNEDTSSAPPMSPMTFHLGPTELSALRAAIDADMALDMGPCSQRILEDLYTYARFAS